jgi:UDP-3-O-[3-hydroxymyristoyl] glucosamine N-acyltransferase
MAVRLARPISLGELASKHGGELRVARDLTLSRVAPLKEARAGDLAPLLAARHLRAAEEAHARGAVILAAVELAPRAARIAGWLHPFASWALAGVLDAADDARPDPALGPSCVIGEHVVLERGVVLGARVRIGHGSVIGRPGFGWATGPNGEVRAIPQLGGVVIEDDVVVGALSTVDAGTLGPTILRRGAKLDAHVHVGHNVEIGEGTLVAAQTGFAGSVTVGKGVLVGGQVGVADHVTIGDGAKIAAKSGVIGDVPPGAVVAGYPAVARGRWLRALARMYRSS